MNRKRPHLGAGWQQQQRFLRKWADLGLNYEPVKRTESERHSIG
jgi:hypothetical protein